ncbi:hypothetical protein C8F01DRAFT_1139102 [Mycena amicta]|nr:hypothetical protein C8F01DRAFT_1139102 [Mycena amicta]
MSRTLDSPPDEVITRIFSFTLIPESSHHAGLRVAGVTPRWRQLALNTPFLWNKLLLSHDREPSVLQEIITRSQSLPLEVEIRLEAFRFRFQTEYTESLDILVSQIHRWRSFTVFATNPVLHTIRNRIQGVTMPLLEHLQLVQTDNGQIQHLGPLVFDSTVFRSLHLERTMIYAEDCTMLAGITYMKLIESSLAMLDENKLLSLEYPGATTHPRAPSMTRLEHIHLDSTNPTGTTDGLPYSPAFDPANITSVSLFRLVAPSFDGVQALSRFYGVVLRSPSLRILSIADIHGHALVMLLPVIRSLRFPPLQRLSFTEIDTDGIDDRVVDAFAAGVTELVLAKLDSGPFLSRRKMWLGLERFEIDGVEV